VELVDVLLGETLGIGTGTIKKQKTVFDVERIKRTPTNKPL